MYRLAISEFSTYSWSLEKEVQELSRRGIRQIGLWRTKLSDMEIDAAADLLYAADIRVSSLSWAGGFTGTCGMSFEEAIDDAMLAIRTAARIGSGCLVVHSGSRGGHTRNHACKLLRTALDRLLPVASDYGVTLGLEIMECSEACQWTIMDSHQQVIDLVRNYATSCLGLVLDLFYAGKNDSIAEEIRNSSPNIALVQVSDRIENRDGTASRCLPGEGDISFLRWFEALDKAGYTGPWEIELHGHMFGPPRYRKMLDDSVLFLKQLHDQARPNHSMSPLFRTL
jgi:sugar phosphate isomerase/epimerase